MTFKKKRYLGGFFVLKKWIALAFDYANIPSFSIYYADDISMMGFDFFFCCYVFASLWVGSLAIYGSSLQSLDMFFDLESVSQSVYISGSIFGRFMIYSFLLKLKASHLEFASFSMCFLYWLHGLYIDCMVCILIAWFVYWLHGSYIDCMVRILIAYFIYACFLLIK